MDPGVVCEVVLLLHHTNPLSTHGILNVIRVCVRLVIVDFTAKEAKYIEVLLK